MMSIKKIITNYVNYNQWANEKFVLWLQSENEGILVKKTPSSFSTPIETIQHITKAQIFWMKFVENESVSNFDWNDNKENSSTVLDRLKENSEEMSKLFCQYNEAALQEILHLDMPWAQNKRCRYDYMMHVINHASFHRGQLVTMARALGITIGIPQTDYNIYNSL